MVGTDEIGIRSGVLVNSSQTVSLAEHSFSEFTCVMLAALSCLSPISGGGGEVAHLFSCLEM